MLKRPLWLFVCMVVPCIVFAFSGQTQKPANDRETALKPSHHSGLPVVGELVRHPEPPEDHAGRQLKEQWYRQSTSPREVKDPGQLVNGEMETINLRFIDTVEVGQSTEPRGLPVSLSAVVIGSILSGECFVDEVRTTVYTDYKLKIVQVLKDSTATLSVGGQVVASRPEGAVHFPSGHTTNYLIQGMGLPQIGSEYILFLLPIPNLPEYEIATGYELKNGRVYSLDDENGSANNMDQTTFIKQVQTYIAQQGGTKP
jgi:hypothetical protein